MGTVFKAGIWREVSGSSSLMFMTMVAFSPSIFLSFLLRPL